VRRGYPPAEVEAARWWAELRELAPDVSRRVVNVLPHEPSDLEYPAHIVAEAPMLRRCRELLLPEQ
jgi:hypothetical protein